jgi:hypothetical protein
LTHHKADKLDGAATFSIEKKYVLKIQELRGAERRDSSITHCFLIAFEGWRRGEEKEAVG